MENSINLVEKKKMLIDSWIKSGIITNKSIISAFKKVKRENFMIRQHRLNAYDDNAFPILACQTISQPTTVMLMTQLLDPKKGNKVLEVGTGSGYQAALIAEIIKPGIIYSTEIIPELYGFAQTNLRYYKNVRLYLLDGSVGLNENSPYDRIIVTAACSKKPMHLIEQLSDNGILIAPIGNDYMQEMYKFIKVENKIHEEIHGEFRFVPLKGKFGFKG